MRATSSQVATETIVRRYSPTRAAFAGDRAGRTAGPGHRRPAPRGRASRTCCCIRGPRWNPPGDEITADIARECANDVIKELKALDVQHRGAITLDGPRHGALDAGAQGRGRGRGRSRRRRRLGRADRAHPRRVDADVTFLMFLTLACLLAAIGVVTDSHGHRGRRHGARARSSGRWPRSRSRWCSDGCDLARRAPLALLVGFPIAMGITAVGHAGRRGGRLARPGAGQTRRARSTSSSRSGRCRSSSRCSRARPGCSRWCRRSRAAWSGCSSR